MMKQTDPERMNTIAKLAFAPVYDYLARQIKSRFGITKGTCVDIGSGPASLAIAMAKITSLKFFALDIQPEMATIASANITEAGFSSVILPITADAARLPFDDNSIDLVISRGSIFFWENRPAAFIEIFRVLKPGGAAYCGGGMGNDKIKKMVEHAFDNNPELKGGKEEWEKITSTVARKLTPETLAAELVEANVRGDVIRENGGIWVQIRK
jgi:ubiquinone/menaquinone biosynthesis C-methylase UbiE